MAFAVSNLMFPSVLPVGRAEGLYPVPSNKLTNLLTICGGYSLRYAS